MAKKQKASHCKECGVAWDSKFRGKLCHTHYKKYQNQFYKRYKKEVTNNPNKENKVSYYQKNKEIAKEKRKSYYAQNRDEVLKRQRTANAFRTWRKSFVLRKPKRPNKDTEIYCSNDVWAIDHFMFLNFDYLKHIPMEELSIEYWITEEIEYQVYLENHNKKYGQTIPRYVSDKAYLEPDKEYGVQEDGSIRFWPT